MDPPEISFHKKVCLGFQNVPEPPVAHSWTFSQAKNTNMEGSALGGGGGSWGWVVKALDLLLICCQAWVSSLTPLVFDHLS